MLFKKASKNFIDDDKLVQELPHIRVRKLKMTSEKEEWADITHLQYETTLLRKTQMQSELVRKR